MATAVLGVALAFSALALDKFDTEAQAQRHCPKDVVVWLNLPTTNDRWAHAWWANEGDRS